MAGAQVTLKLTPSEFDLAREALDKMIASDKNFAVVGVDYKLRREARARAVQAKLLRDKLR